jgi:hypothetical protein
VGAAAAGDGFEPGFGLSVDLEKKVKGRKDAESRERKLIPQWATWLIYRLSANCVIARAASLHSSLSSVLEMA